MPAQAPFIPRAVSPVHFEPLRPDADEDLCPGSDVDESPDERERKRRRVEKAAQEYLRGKSLYIASARLKGPFPPWWHNPYATKKGKTRAVIHETQSKSEGRQGPKGPAQDGAFQLPKSKVQTGIEQPQAKGDPPLIQRSRRSPIERTEAVPGRRQSQLNVEEECGITQESFVTATSEGYKEVESRKLPVPETLDWLKTTRPPNKRPVHSRPRSPTPTPASRQRKQSPKHLASHKVKPVDERLTHKAASVVSTSEANGARQLSLDNVPSRAGKANSSFQITKSRVQENKPSLHVLPPFINTPGFEYRYIPANNPHSPKRKSFKEDLEAAKKRARLEEKRRLSFTASGNIKDRYTRTSARGSYAPSPSHIKSESSLSPRGTTQNSSTGSKERASRPELQAGGESTSGRVVTLPEAQIVQQPGSGHGRSVPSTELLETEKQSLKFPSTDDLSTQAAMLQAQRSLQDDVNSPIALAGNHGSDDNPINEHDRHFLQAKDKCELARVPCPELPAPAAADEPMSTQAMLDAVSPFAVTTIKKRPLVERDFDLARSASGSSPASPSIRDFRAASPSMSTTPPDSPGPTNNDAPIPLSALSKPTSTISSFSIAPNGTMTEVMQFDGQQQQQNYHMGDSDLDAALEEAGSFLGDWSVEKEAKQLNKSNGGSKGSTANASIF